jgi:hypothetical protein
VLSAGIVHEFKDLFLAQPRALCVIAVKGIKYHNKKDRTVTLPLRAALSLNLNAYIQ